MKYSTEFSGKQKKTDHVFIFIGKTRYKMREQDGNLHVSKSSEATNDSIRVYPRAANVIELD
jgi:hypothetical protein